MYIYIYIYIILLLRPPRESLRGLSRALERARAASGHESSESPHEVRIHTIKNPGSRNSGASRCPGKTRPIKRSICLGRAPEFPDFLPREPGTAASLFWNRSDVFFYYFYTFRCLYISVYCY